MKKPTILLFSAALLALSACSSPSTPKESSSSGTNPIQVEETFSFKTKSVSLQEGQTKKIEFTASSKASFVSSNPSVAEMDSSGLLIAKASGQATITGKVGSKVDTLEVTVIEESSAILDIVLPSYQVLTLESGKNSVQLEPKLYSGEAEKPATFSYSSGNEEVAKVDEKGKVTALKEGKTEIEISAEGVTTHVSVDIYTRYLKTANDWIQMVSTHNDRTSRYALNGDIDFAGIEYTGIADSSMTGFNEAFRSEINGFGHSVSNITFSKKVFIQSLFGVMQGAVVRNLCFDNVTFTQEEKGNRLSGLGYPLTDNAPEIPDELRRSNRFENLYLDLTFPAADLDKAGLFSSGYVYHASNIFLNMKNVDGSDFNTQKCAAVNGSQYFWWGNGTLSNSVICSTNTLGVTQGNAGDVYGTLQMNKVDLVSNEMDAMVSAYSCLSPEVWDLHGKDVPTLKNTIH